MRKSLTNLAPLLVAAACALSACSSVPQGSDMTTSTADMWASVDQATGPSCGEIVTCIVTCGVSKPSCDATCTQGASATEGMKALALALCAGLHCVGSDAGTGVPAILGCLLSNCQSEVTACDGLL